MVELGSFAVRLDAPSGASLEPIRPSRPRLRPREPVFDDLATGEVLGRESDLTQIRMHLAVPGTRAVVVHGPPGVGKSTILAALASDARVRAASPGGLFALPARHQTAHDCALALYRRLQDGTAPLRTPTERELAGGLAGCDALVVLDDVAPSFALETLLRLAPRASFLIASSQPLAPDASVNYALGGLEEADAVRLLARDLDPWSSSEVREAGRTLCALLEGNPGRIRQLVSHARAMEWRLCDLAEHLEGPDDFDRTRLAEIASKLDAEQRSVLDAAALFGEAVFCGTTAEDPAYADINALEERRMLDRAFAGRKLATGLDQSLASQLDDPDILDATIAWFEARFDAHAEQMLGDPGRLADLSESVRRLAAYQRPAAVVRLGRAIADTLAARGEWRAWQETISHVAIAADLLGDRAAQAWADHQMGVYALAAGERNVARAALEAALELREALRDVPGAELTRGQLTLLNARRSPSGGRPAARTIGLISGIGLGAGIAAGLLVAVAGGRFGPSPAQAPAIVYFEVMPRQVREGRTATLCYKVVNASSASIDTLGPVGAHGRLCVGVRPHASRNYRLTAVGERGSRAEAVFGVTVIPRDGHAAAAGSAS
jgi:hypothetical protein